ncbi:17976_t:CDS:2 [Entrophospora sp. SA101]|nr:17976_t:CDS:2 [Entrophospora sp. SA101]
MHRVPLFISNNINQLGLKPEDLISNGIINEIELERKFPIFYNNLIKVGLVKKTKIIKYVEMSEDTCAFINNFFKYNKVEVPLSVGLEQSFYHELLGMMLKILIEENIKVIDELEDIICSKDICSSFTPDTSDIFYTFSTTN